MELEQSKSEVGDPPPVPDLEGLWRQLMTARQRFTEARNAARASAERAEEQAREAGEVIRRDRDVLRREREIRERELNAEQGFLTQNRQALARLDEEADSLRGQLTELRETISRETVEARGRRAAAESSWREEWDRRRSELEVGLNEKEQARLLADRAAHDRVAEVEIREQTVRERESLLDRLIAARAEERVRVMKLEVATERATVEEYREQTLRLQAILREQETAGGEMDGRPAADWLREHEVLRAQCRAQQQELANRLPAHAAEELRQLQTEREDWAGERGELKAENRGLKDERQHLREQARGADQQRGEIQLLEQQRNVLEERIAQLRKTIDEHLKAADGGTPFKGCSAMDANPELQNEPARHTLKNGIGRLAGYLRNRMAEHSTEHAPLYYTEGDVRSLLAGMAMSRLLLLQGMSGIGKTSLPRAVSRVLGGEARVIPVQAGWRDRHDLLGHYNTFEGRYRESEFLQALYEAGTPRYRDGVFFIVLDEINLSRPEQFFASILSALELGEHERQLELVDIPVAKPPKLLVEGRKLAIPRNVWFVGTANQDETTLEFADKTIDRAHVLELPAAPEEFTAKKETALTKGVSVSKLLQLFQEAEAKHTRDIDNVHAMFFDVLRGELASRFSIGLSGRLASQLKRYVANVVEAGGSASEAADHLLATRLLRHLKDRHDLRVPELQEFETLLVEKWQMLDRKEEPRQSRRLVQGELRRLQGTLRTGA
jgi:hypothetical protein